MTLTLKRIVHKTQVSAETSIDEAMIRCLVRSFYGKVRNDDLLGPVFGAHITNWEQHLQNMFAFWSSVTLMTGRYHGQPMAKHLTLPVDSRHFDRWLALFAETTDAVCPPAAASHFIERANRIAQSLELGIAGHNGTLLIKGERLKRPDSEVFLADTSKMEQPDDRSG